MLTAKPSIILIVNKQPTNLKMLFSFLQESGFKVLVEKTGEKAIKKLQQVSPDLIMLDVTLPGIDGFETCRCLKAMPETKDIPVMFMTALSESMDRIKGFKVGAVDCITSLLQPEEILARIANQLQLSRRQKQLEEQNQQLQQEISTLRHIEEENRALLAAIPDVMLRQRVDGTYLDIREKEGYSIVPSEVIGKKLRDFPVLPEAVQQGILEHLQAAVETGKLQTYEYELLMPDGVHTYESRFVKSNADEALRIIRDVTERKKAEERLRLLERAIAASNNGIIISDAIAPNNPIIYVNSGFERMTGYRKEEVIGKQCCSWERTCATPSVLEEVRRALTEGKETQVTLRSYRKDGTLFWSELCITPVRDDRGRLTHFIGVQTDISDRKQAEDQLASRHRELLTLQRISEIHLSTRSLKATFGEIVEEVSAVTGFPIVAIERYDESRQVMVFEGMKGIELPPDVRVLEVPTDQTLSGTVAHTGQPVIKTFASEEAKPCDANETLSQLGLQTFICIPMTVSERVWGTLSLAHPEVVSFDNHLLQWIGSLANYVASLTSRKQAQIELETAKAALERQIQRALLLNQITQEIRSSLTHEQIFQTAATQIGQAFGVNRCIIHTYIAEPFPRIPQVAEYIQPDYPSMMAVEIPVIGNPHAELVLSQDRAIASHDVYKDPLLEGISDIMQQLNLKSVLVVRTSYQGQPNGIICMEQCDCFRVWTAEEIELLEAVAAQMGIAIAGANLLEREKQRTQELDEQNHQLQQEIRERQRAELALRESQRFIQAIADANPSLLYLYDLNEQRNVYTNCQIAAILSYTPEELQELGNAFFPTLMYPEDWARFPSHLQKFETAKDGDILEYEYRMRHKDGCWRWIVSRDTVFARNPDGKPRQLVGTATDISDRKKAEIELATAKAALERQIQRALLLERITQEIRSSLKHEQIFQTAATQIGKVFSVNRCLIHTYVDHPIPKIPIVAEYKEPGTESVLSVEIPVSGNPYAELLLTQDRAIASDDVYADPLLEVTSSLCQQLGLKSMLVVRTSYQGKPNGVICLHQCDRFRHWGNEDIELLEAVAAQVGIAIAQANLLEGETRRRRELAAQNHALEKAKLAAEAANRAKSQFLSKMSHELRTPLNAILGFTQVMARDSSLNQHQQENLGIINRSGSHLLQLINDILSMSKIEAGGVGLNENRFDLYNLLYSLEEMLQLKARAKGLHLVFEKTPDLPQYVQTDESKLRQVLINLLENAIKFTQTGRVTLRVGMGQGAWDMGHGEEVMPDAPSLGCGGVPQPRPIPRLWWSTTASPLARLLFEVEDTGSGIAADELPTLFEAFVQTQTGRSSMEGTGLGLAISRQFVRLMGGDITVSSQPGRGTIFTFDIQVGLATGADARPLSSQRRVIGLEPNQPKYRILVVEDVVENRQLLVKLLEPLGFEVRAVANGQEGVALWESWSPHLIWMDILMPVMDGYEATKQIKQTPKGQDTVIIALSASAFEEQREAALGAGCDDFMSKPLQEEVLLEKIAHHLGVRYVYEDSPQPTSPQPGENLKLLTPEDLAVMPCEWRSQLHQAAACCTDVEIFTLLEQIPEPYAALKLALARIVDNFRFDLIIDLTTGS